MTDNKPTKEQKQSDYYCLACLQIHTPKSVCYEEHKKYAKEVIK